MNLAERAAAQYETSLAETKEVRVGYEQLRQLYAEKDEECSAALRAWSTDRSQDALERLQVARSNLATVKELMEADLHAVAPAEASMEFYKARVVEAEVVE